MSTLTSVTTNIAREKMVKARAGERTLPPISQMAFGRGGVDAAGNIKQPLAAQTALNDEIARKDIESYSFPILTTCRYVCRLVRGELAGEDISEIALIDAEGDIVAIKNFKAKGKDSDIEMIFELDDEF
ncbi:phage tail-collar fiber domain-containing protein [Cellulosilyticum sp. I15G10I2]|uniref:phage tail-collar fiber domain-containing protein n=1 Tax=Cellulosilyticum sp. I15G10I2 TaxID=1892843 RepID=UPI001FA71D3B|nr:phage tail protein [Cellulosilyticum sp. I15G10I2]